MFPVKYPVKCTTEKETRKKKRARYINKTKRPKQKHHLLLLPRSPMIKCGEKYDENKNVLFCFVVSFFSHCLVASLATSQIRLFMGKLGEAFTHTQTHQPTNQQTNKQREEKLSSGQIGHLLGHRATKGSPLNCST